MPVGKTIVTADELVAKMKDARLLLYFCLASRAVLAQSGRVDATGLARAVHMDAFRAALKRELIQARTHYHAGMAGAMYKVVYELAPKAGGRKRP